MANQTESEFGGKGVNRAGVHPLPHIPVAHEQLSLIYRTGDPSGLTNPDDGEIFSGLRKEAPLRREREAAGVFDKGQVADDLLIQAQSQIAMLHDLAVPE
jgi:hypothetical protein